MRTYLAKAICFLVISSTFVACLNTTDKEKSEPFLNQPTTEKMDSANFTTIQWLDSVKNLGTIQEGQILKISFRFKNTGTKPLILENVQPGCGCTLAEYPKEPIASGKEAEIVASFDSKGREGEQHKSINVTANTAERNYTLRFDVIVKKS